VGSVDEGLELRIRSEMRIDLSEVGYPIAVIARTVGAGAALHGFVLKDRSKPNRGHPKPLNIIEPVDQTFKVATMIEALVRGIEAVRQPVTLDPAAVVLRVAILKPVREKEIDHLVLRKTLAEVLGGGGGG
jgi:hypothetical protein